MDTLAFDSNMTVSENISYLLTLVSDNSALHILEQTISHRGGRGDITPLQVKCFLEVCKNLRDTEEHYNRKKKLTIRNISIS